MPTTAPAPAATASVTAATKPAAGTHTHDQVERLAGAAAAACGAMGTPAAEHLGSPDG